MALRLLLQVSILLIGAGTLLLLFYGFSQVAASRGHEQGIAAFESARNAQQQAMQVALATPTMVVEEHQPDDGPMSAGSADPVLLAGAADTPDTTLWSAKRIAEYEKYSRKADADDVPEGIMRIPSVDMKLPLFYGTQEANLTRGAGLIEGTASLGSPGNVGIAAHRDGYFRALKDVQIGDLIEVETLAGTLNYRIDDISIVYPEDIYVLDPTDESVLTLVTCYPFYFTGSAPQRFIVRAIRH